MSKKKQIAVRPTANENVREYHVDGETISERGYEDFWHPMWGSEPEFEILGSKGKSIAASLMSKSHEKLIARTVFRPQSVRVYKTPSANWAELENNIVIPALKKALGADFQPIQYGTAQHRELALA